jgi:hypothetical protein
MTTREKVNLTLWIVTVRRAFHAAAAGPRKDLLKAMLVNLIARTE